MRGTALAKDTGTTSARCEVLLQREVTVVCDARKYRRSGGRTRRRMLWRRKRRRCVHRLECRSRSLTRTATIRGGIQRRASSAAAGGRLVLSGEGA
eukprot:295644-Rhodomonas_salina.2